MKPERWDEIDRVLQSVLERVPEQRRAFVNEVCADDEQLRRGVLSALDSYERAGSFMESPVVAEVAHQIFSFDWPGDGKQLVMIGGATANASFRTGNLTSCRVRSKKKSCA